MTQDRQTKSRFDRRSQGPSWYAESHSMNFQWKPFIQHRNSSKNSFKQIQSHFLIWYNLFITPNLARGAGALTETLTELLTRTLRNFRLRLFDGKHSLCGASERPAQVSRRSLRMAASVNAYVALSAASGIHRSSGSHRKMIEGSRTCVETMRSSAESRQNLTECAFNWIAMR